jgi:O-antigen ligase
MSEVLTSNYGAATDTGFSRSNVARLIGAGVFYSLLIVIALAAIPYGSAEPWWQAFSDCAIFLIATAALIGKLLDRRTRNATSSTSVIYPLLAFLAFALIQTISWSGRATAAAITFPRTLSADVFQTRLFFLHLSALILAGWLLVRNATTQKRVRHLVETIIVVGVVSAGFGLWRQATQQGAGFILPSLRPSFGYGQFINANHFAFLMEMALGVTLGIVVCRGVDGVRLVVYLLAGVPMWSALVLANSRGGLISIFCQSAFLAVLLVSERAGKVTQKRRFSRLGRIALQLVLGAIILIGAATALVLVGGDHLAQRIDSISGELDAKTAESYTLRQNIWQASWQLIKDRPFAGAGFGGYWIAITKYHHASGETTPQQAHNDYLELVASGGLTGLGIGVWFVVAFVRAAGRRLRTADRFERAVALGALAGLLTIAVHSLVDFGLHIPINALVCTALVALVLARSAKVARTSSAVQVKFEA